ncbi:MAG: hypothetical protein ACT4QA_24490 [Panacagrimonas sp.]
MPVESPDRFIPLSPDAAFVVQLRQADPEHPEQLSGRVEHIASGKAMGFASLSELHRFMSRAPGVTRPGNRP